MPGNTSAAKIDQGVSLVNAMIPPEVPVARGLIEISKYDAITKRNRTANYATTEFSAETVQNQETVANRLVYSAQQYQNEMVRPPKSTTVSLIRQSQTLGPFLCQTFARLH